MAGMREQLTELLTKLDVYNCEECRNCGSYRYDLECSEECFCGKVADYLISKGVVPVVRCKDCWSAIEVEGFMGGVLYCKVWGRDTDGECFCSYGERKVGAE